MRNRRWIVNAVMFLILTACNLPSNETPLSTPTVGTLPSTSSTPIPIETLLALQTPTPKPTFTPSLSVAFTIDAPVNCRSGPGTSYTVVGELRVGRQAEIVGKNIDVSWWYVKNPNDPSTFCWLAAFLVNTEGDVDSLPVVNPPEIVVTTINVSVDPPVMNVACDGFPRLVTINAQITTNGPATVIWRWEESATGEVSSEKNILFEEGGTKTVQDLYQVKNARDYTMVVRTLQPNILAGESNFKAVCTP
jgi:hypothetical protein